HGKGHASGHPPQRLPLRGQPLGHQGPDEGGRGGAIQRAPRQGPHAKPCRQEAALPPPSRHPALLEQGDRHVARRGPDRVLLRNTVGRPSQAILQKNQRGGTWVSATTNRRPPAAGKAPSAISPISPTGRRSRRSRCCAPSPRRAAGITRVL